MHPIYLAYLVLTSGVFTAGLPYALLYSKITGRYKKNFSQRVGLFPSSLVLPVKRSTRIWLHAVSMGEVTAAVPIIEAIRKSSPGFSIVLSTSTEHGQGLARSRLSSDVSCIYAPVDFVFSVISVLERIKPDILVCLETELWPNLLMAANLMGIKTAIVNGRISSRTIKSYMKIRPLMKEVLGRIDAFSMINAIDAKRIQDIGASPEKIVINGNAKFDLMLERSGNGVKEKIQQILKLNGREMVFMAGSTRPSEEEVILDAYQKIIQKLPETILIIAPRHTERADQIQKIISQRGLQCRLRTDLEKSEEPRTAPIIIMDSMGELKDAYSVANIVFCGGSLAKFGGQNILEPAVWGKPVLYGSSMEDFIDAKNLLEKAGGGIEVKNGDELAEKAIFFLSNPEQAQKTGSLARNAVELNQGAAQKHASVICSLMDKT